MRIRTRSAIVMLSTGLTQAAMLVMAVILVRLLSKEVFGTYRQVLLVYIFLSGLVEVRLGDSLFYFVPKTPPDRQRALLGQTVLISMVLATIAAAVMFFFAEPLGRMFSNPALARPLRAFSLYPFVAGVMLLIPSFMISQDRAVRAGLYSITHVLARMCAVLVLFLIGASISWVMGVAVIAAGTVALYGYADMVRLCPPGRWRPDRRMLWQQLHYVWPLWLTAAVAKLNVQLDKLLISTFFDPETFAVYACGAIQLPIVGILTASINTAMMPNLVSLVDAGKPRQALAIWHQGARKASLVILPCFAFFIVIGPDLMTLLYGPAYAMAVWPFWIYLIRLPLGIVIFGSIFRALGRIRPVAVAAFLGLAVQVVVATTLLWAGRGTFLAFVGPPVATVCSSFVAAAYLLLRLRKALSIPMAKAMKWLELGAVLLLSGLAGLVVFFIPLPRLPLAAKLGAQALIFGVVYLGLLLGSGALKDDERELLRYPIRLVRRLRDRGRKHE